MTEQQPQQQQQQQQQQLQQQQQQQKQNVGKEGYQQNVVAAAVNIARAAQLAQTQATAANRKVDFIEELARRARDEADSLHDVAAQLTATATSVAIIALDACRNDGERKRLRQQVAVTSDAPLITHDATVNVDNFDSLVESLQLGRQEELAAPPAVLQPGQQSVDSGGNDDHSNSEVTNKDTAGIPSDTKSKNENQRLDEHTFEVATPSPATMSMASATQRANEDAVREKDRCIMNTSDVIIKVDETTPTLNDDGSSRHRQIDFGSEGSEDIMLTAELTKREQQRRKLKPISLCKASVETGTESGAEASPRVFSPVARGGAFTWVDTRSLHMVSGALFILTDSSKPTM